jgi:transposase
MHSPVRSVVQNPRTIDDLIAPNSKARVVWRLVESLDLELLYRNIKSVVGHPGRPAVDPRILVALWLYATSEHISSAHELARRTIDCDPYKWICGGVSVNYHTLADFRLQNSEWLANQIKTLIVVMRAEESASLDKVGQDGMRVRAHAGNDSFLTAEELSSVLKQAQERWAQLQQESEQTNKLTPRQRAAQVRAARERLQRIQQAQEELKKVALQREKRKRGDGATARVSITDPEARRMKMGDGGFRPAYNVEFATDLENLVIVGFDVTNAGNDAGQMEPMVQTIEATQAPFADGAEYYVDGDFATTSDIQSLGERGITVIAPVKEATRQLQSGKNPYVRRRDDPPHVGDWRERMGTPEAQENYKQRSKTEFPNAVCRNYGLHQFLVRGLKNVWSVIMWYVFTFDLFRREAIHANAAITTA